MAVTETSSFYQPEGQDSIWKSCCHPSSWCIYYWGWKVPWCITFFPSIIIKFYKTIIMSEHCIWANRVIVWGVEILEILLLSLVMLITWWYSWNLTNEIIKCFASDSHYYFNQFSCWVTCRFNYFLTIKLNNAEFICHTWQ